MHTGTVKRIQRFPIKGLSAEPLDSVTLRPGDGIPGDRMFGFARHGAGFDPENPQPLPKDKFVVLVNQAALAGLSTSFTPEDGHLRIDRAGQVHVFDMQTDAGRSGAAGWLSDYLSLPVPSAPDFVSAAPHRFTDVSVVSPQMMSAISVLNRTSVADLGVRLDADIDPARFRANIEIDGLPAWWELENVGSTLEIGPVVLRILKRTKRCAATEVNPDTAERDLKLPFLLRKELGHMDMGVYVEVVRGGTIHLGDDVSLAHHSS